MTDLWNQLTAVLGESLPGLLAALAILVVGWLAATLVAKAVRAALKRTRIDDRLAALIRGERERTGVDVGRGVATGVFYLIMLFVVIAVCQALSLTLVTEPLSTLLDRILVYLPRILGAAILLLVAWVAATVLRRVVTGALRAARIDERLSAEDKTEAVLAGSVGEAAYWLVFLLFLPAVLGALELQGILRPVENLMDDVLTFLPNILGAALIGTIGWFVAGIVRRVVENLVRAAGADRLGARLGLPDAAEKKSVSGALGLIVYVLILVPVLISALDSLGLESITDPATSMLYVAFDAVPAVLGAALILLLAFLIARLLGSLVTRLLETVGLDAFLARAGMIKESASGRSAASVVGTLVVVAVMLFAVAEAADILGFEVLSGLTAQFMVFATQVLAGLLIFAVGLYLANLAASALRAGAAAQSELLARVAWTAIVLLSAAMGLRRMGLANDIINTAFGLMLGAVAVAAAIAFGIGGREVAGRALGEWFDSSRKRID
jgi:hypothetical protein